MLLQPIQVSTGRYIVFTMYDTIINEYFTHHNKRRVVTEYYSTIKSTML